MLYMGDRTYIGEEDIVECVIKLLRKHRNKLCVGGIVVDGTVELAGDFCIRLMTPEDKCLEAYKATDSGLERIYP